MGSPKMLERRKSTGSVVPFPIPSLKASGGRSGTDIRSNVVACKVNEALFKVQSHSPKLVKRCHWEIVGKDRGGYDTNTNHQSMKPEDVSQPLHQSSKDGEETSTRDDTASSLPPVNLSPRSDATS